MIRNLIISNYKLGGIMDKQISNIKFFEEFELSEKDQKEAIGYVCYERVIYYLFKQY